MKSLSRILAMCLLAFSVYANEVDFTAMSLEELEAYETDGLEKDDAKAHKKALKKARKEAIKAARKANPQKAYCSRLAKARGSCS